jgi:hypothetical protein
MAEQLVYISISSFYYINVAYYILRMNKNSMLEGVIIHSLHFISFSIEIF